jgi:hypothetical protein
MQGYFLTTERVFMSAFEVFLFTALLVTAIGCALGFTNRIVVFRNYDDLGMVFLATVPLFIGFISAIPWILIPAAITSVALVCFLAWRSWLDNTSFWKLLIALPTKLVLSVLFIAFVWDLLSPNGKTQLDRAKQRGFAAVVLAVITPVIYRLVKEKTGVFVPRDVLKNTRRGLTHGS